MMKIYFAGSIRGGRDDAKIYVKIINELKLYGKVLTEHIADTKLLATGEVNISNKEIHDRDIDFINESNVMVCEVTNPSLGVGYEIGRGVNLNKKILALFRPSEGRRLSAMIDGNDDVEVRHYQTIEEVKIIIEEFFK